jgi:aldehyde dehydrogenase (NAD+)
MISSRKIDSVVINDIFRSQKSVSALWKTQNISQRKGRLKKIKRWIEDHRIDIQNALYADFKKPSAEVDLSEIYPALSEINHALKNLQKWTNPVKVNATVALLGSKSYIQYEPKGVCLIIAPWNFPFNLTLAPLVSALAAGNTAILKPSELTPNCSKLISELVDQLFDPSEVAVFNGDKEVVKQLLELPFDHIFFTGSPAVGKIVMQNAAQHLTSITLELGGKSPAVVDKTADLADAAEKLVWGKFLNGGQTCIAPDYLLVDEAIEEQLLDHLCTTIDRFFDPEGEGIEASSSFARIINYKHLKHIQSLLAESIQAGAKIEYGGVANESDNYFSPTLLSNVPLDATVMKEEIFGPILPILSYRHADEAIGIINSKPKPLALYIFSKSSNFKDQVLHNTSSGSVAINDCLTQFMNPHLPFGGVNHSGFGKSHGYSGFQAFSNQKSVLVQKTGLTSVKPLFPPYTNLTKRAIDFLLKYL